MKEIHCLGLGNFNTEGRERSSISRQDTFIPEMLLCDSMQCGAFPVSFSVWPAKSFSPEIMLKTSLYFSLF